jgi:hypothetical protein
MDGTVIELLLPDYPPVGFAFETYEHLISFLKVFFLKVS